MKKWWPIIPLKGWAGIISLALMLAFATSAVADPMEAGYRYKASVICSDLLSVASLTTAFDRNDDQAATDMLNDMTFLCVAAEQATIPLPFWPVVISEKVADLGKYGIYTGTLQLTGLIVYVYHIDRDVQAI